MRSSSLFMSAAFLVLTLVSCRLRSEDSLALKVYGGDAVLSTDAIHSVLANFEKQERQGSFAPFCSGTLIGPNTILTAAHCLDDAKTQEQIDSKKIRVRFGFSSSSPDKIYRDIADVKIHPCYEKVPTNFVSKSSRERYAASQDYDIAVVKLSAPVQNEKGFGSWFPTLGSEKLAKGSPVLAAGYGYRDGKKLGDLYRTDLNVYSLLMSPRQIIAIGEDYGKKPHGTDEGDSGGPLFLGNPATEVVGVLSWGPKPTDHDNYFIKVGFFKDWIESAAFVENTAPDLCPLSIQAAEFPLPFNDENRGPAQCRISATADPSIIHTAVYTKFSNDEIRPLTDEEKKKEKEHGAWSENFDFSAPLNVQSVAYCINEKASDNCDPKSEKALRLKTFAEGKNRKCFRLSSKEIPAEHAGVRTIGMLTNGEFIESASMSGTIQNDHDSDLLP